MEKNGGNNPDTTRKFEENPYNPDKMAPEDVMRLFFTNDLPIIPVISRTGVLLGILKKDDLVSELSDIDRVKLQKTDQFIHKLIKKMNLDDLLPYVTQNREFTVIDIFGEVKGKWTRIQLLEASESSIAKKTPPREIKNQRDEQTLEWMIYLILEHVPRALYAQNNRGKTMFYNSHFEEILAQTHGEDINIEAVEQSISKPEKNDFYYNDNDEILFYNQDYNFYYEKIPLKNRDETIGFLIYCDKESNIPVTALTSKKNLKKQTLAERLHSIEKVIITESLKEYGNKIEKTAASLKITPMALQGKIKKMGIIIENSSKKTKKK